MCFAPTSILFPTFERRKKDFLQNLEDQEKKENTIIKIPGNKRRKKNAFKKSHKSRGDEI